MNYLTYIQFLLSNYLTRIQCWKIQTKEDLFLFNLLVRKPKKMSEVWFQQVNTLVVHVGSLALAGHKFDAIAQATCHFAIFIEVCLVNFLMFGWLRCFGKYFSIELILRRFKENCSSLRKMIYPSKSKENISHNSFSTSQ